MTIETEWAVLGSLIMDNSLVAELVCQPEDFVDETCSTIYGAVRDLLDAGEPADAITISSRLKDQTGRDYMQSVFAITEATPSTVNAKHYHKLLMSRSRVRRARQLTEDVQSIKDAGDIQAVASQLMALCVESGKRHQHTQTDSVRAAIDRLEQYEQGVEPGLPTGLATLDDKLGGLQPSDLVIIAARSQHGKTALMSHIANSQTEPVGIISGEQPHEQIGMRSLAMVGNVRLSDMRRGRLEDRHWERLLRAAQELSQRKVLIYDRGNPSISEIEVQARRWAFHHGIKALFVDFLQLVSGGSGEAHRLQIGDVVYRLKALAKDLQINVTALAQVSRKVDSYAEGNNFLGRMPYTQDIADSAKIEDGADQIITLYRPQVYWPNVDRLQGRAYLNVCKNRHGPVGIVPVQFVPEFVQFKDIEAQAAA